MRCPWFYRSVLEIDFLLDFLRFVVNKWGSIGSIMDLVRPSDRQVQGAPALCQQACEPQAPMAGTVLLARCYGSGNVDQIAVAVATADYRLVARNYFYPATGSLCCSPNFGQRS